MVTRGHIIGKIVDDLSGLKYQIETRNKLGIFDLTKFSEDFFKDLINIIYDLTLKNLNNERNNNPGLDLGDKVKKQAFQITSTKTSQKIKQTLETITAEQKTLYNEIKIFIIGTKQTSYSVDQKLLGDVGFNLDTDIIDLDTLLKDIIVLETSKLDEIFLLFKREFRSLRIELEPVDEEGNYESSIYHNIEQIPDIKPENANKLAERFDGKYFNYFEIIDTYKKLASTPRLSRELISIIAKRGDYKSFNHTCNEWGILPQKLSHIVRMTDVELRNELAILLDAELIYYGEQWIDDNRYHYVTLSWYSLNEIVNWAKDNDISLRKLFNTMDWTVMDE